MTAERTPHAWTPWALLPALALFAALAWKLNFLCDDAFISFRYSRHLAAGEGLRYNLQLGPPVEGYSNFLWVVWLALFERLGLDVPLMARLTSAVCGAALTAWVTWRASRSLSLDPAATVLAGLFFASLPPVALWATGGLATMPTALLLFGVYDRLLADPERPRGWQAGIFAALAGLVRADGTVWVLLLLGAGGLLWLTSQRRAELCAALVQTCAVLFVVVGAHVAWRYSYYGDYLPNTARVKAGFSMFRLARGLDYVVAWLLTVPSIALVLLGSLWRWRPGLREVWLPAGVVIGATLAYGIWVGGDFMPMGRFLFPAVPFIALLFAAWLGRLVAPSGRVSLPGWSLAGALVLANVLACFDLNVVPDSWRARFHFRQDRAWQSELEMRAGMNQRAQEWSVLGRALGRVVEPGETMSAGAIGAMGYYSGLELYDEYGLVTPEVIAAAPPRERSSPGHDVRVDTTFFLDKHPTFAGALIAPSDSLSSYGLFANWESHPFRQLVDVERYPLIDSDGGPDGWELRLLRYRR